MGKRKTRTPHKSSIQVFLELVKYDENGRLDPSKIIQREGYELWLKSRKVTPKRPEDSFRRAFTAHVRGADGRRPFPPEVEQAILEMLRGVGGRQEDGTYRCWPCFSNTKRRIGMLGPQTKGFHEKELEKQSSIEDIELSGEQGGQDQKGVVEQELLPEKESQEEALGEFLEEDDYFLGLDTANTDLDEVTEDDLANLQPLEWSMATDDFLCEDLLSDSDSSSAKGSNPP